MRSPSDQGRDDERAESLLDGRLAEFHRRPAAVAVLLLEALDRADVAPVIHVVELPLADAVDLDDLEQVAVGEELPRKPHRAVEQALVLEEHAGAVVLDEGI